MATQKNQTFTSVKRRHAEAASSLRDEVASLFAGIPKQKLEQYKVALVREKFAQAIIEEYGDRPALFILGKIQAVYLTKDKSPVKASSTASAPVYLDIYTTEAIVKADLDHRQEAIKRRLRDRGVYFDRLRPFSSTGDMRKREHFAQIVKDLKARVEGEEATTAPMPTSTYWTAERIDEATAELAKDNLELAETIRRSMRAWYGITE